MNFRFFYLMLVSLCFTIATKSNGASTITVHDAATHQISTTENAINDSIPNKLPAVKKERYVDWALLSACTSLAGTIATAQVRQRENANPSLLQGVSTFLTGAAFSAVAGIMLLFETARSKKISNQKRRNTTLLISLISMLVLLVSMIF